jgi:membrane protein
MIEHKPYTYRFFNSRIHRFADRLKTISFPGFEKVPVYDVFWFFVDGLKKGSLNLRATAIAFNFLLALGPALVFFLALLPYLPIENFQFILQKILYDLIPSNSYIAIEPLLNEVFQRRGGLTILGLLTGLFFAQKGVHGIIEAFNASYHTIETRSYLRQKIAAVMLVFIFCALAVMASMLFFFGRGLIGVLTDSGMVRMDPRLLYYSNWVIVIVLTFFWISFLYYLVPAKKTQWKFFSAGSTLATILTVIASLGFSYFMDNIAQLNKFFGSIGALVALMLWMNFNAITLLIGFELNASINNAHSPKDPLTKTNGMKKKKKIPEDAISEIHQVLVD